VPLDGNDVITTCVPLNGNDVITTCVHLNGCVPLNKMMSLRHVCLSMEWCHNDMCAFEWNGVITTCVPLNKMMSLRHVCI
jgi:hypothetical protein